MVRKAIPNEVKESSLSISIIEYSYCQVCFSPDGSKIVTASDDDTAKVWHVARGKRKRFCVLSIFIG